MHERPVQHVLVVQGWFSAMQLVSVTHLPFEQRLPPQHSDVAAQTSPFGRHSSLH